MMQDKIMHFAESEHSIRAVILNGSRVSPSAIKDEYQDYDIICIVEDVVPFVKNQKWLKHFGKLIIMQQPDEMDGLWPKQNKKYTFLMLFEDGNRIDLTFMEKGYYLDQPIDSQSCVLLDKDEKLTNLPEPSDSDYLPHPPSEKLFKDRCNEFLWCSQNVVKGLCRKELVYTKYMSENILKGELIKLLSWYAGIKTDHSKNLGAHTKYLEKYIEPELWSKFKDTYVGPDYEKMWTALFDMFEIFNFLATEISKHFHFAYDQEEYLKVLTFLLSKKT